MSPKWFNPSGYTDSNGRTAEVIFLVDRIRKLERNIYFDEVVFFNKKPEPHMRNLVPYYKIGRETSVSIFDEKYGQQLINMGNVTSSNPLNQILYGPPGTGKTYNTINKALEICGEEIGGLTRTEIKELYDQKVQSGQIVFTTFHQSMSYEDFVEGIKPVTEDKKVTYEVKEGVFKKIASVARRNKKLSQFKDNKGTAQVLPFDAAFEELNRRVEDVSLNDEAEVKDVEGLIVKLETSFFGIVEINGSSIRMMNRSGKTKNTMTELTLKKIYEAPDKADDIIKGGMVGYYKALVKLMRGWTKDVVLKEDEVKLKNYVLIIDEINRGNVSSIFGELITLLEPSKREGAKEALSVILPYSQKEFFVPDNLYLIGTMNTADRSVEALDTALRRRFVFEEVLPDASKLTDEDGKPKVVYDDDENEYHLQDILTKINQRIEVLIDRDHTIGHSYFINLEDVKELKSVFENNIIPLLQEYFYEDYGKIGLVLGKGFVKKEDAKKNIFASFKYEGKEELNQSVYRLKSFSEIDFYQAIQSLIGIKKDKEKDE